MINILDNSLNGIITSETDTEITIRVLQSFQEPLFIDWKNVKKGLKIIFDENIKVKLLEINVNNGNCEYIIKENAYVYHNLIALTDGGKGSKKISIEKNGNWKACFADLSSDDVCFDLTCYLNGEKSKGEIHLSTLVKEDGNKVFDINFIHEVQETVSLMENYGVVQNLGSLLFKGVGHIKKSSCKSKANQSAKIMVFDKKCKAIASPILKIDENDVEASHSAAVGKINDEHLFYLMSRGIEENVAKRLITLGYLNPVLPLIFDEEYKKAVEKCILERV